MQYGMGYVEFLSQKKDIEEMLSAGYRFSAIYRKLISNKKITMSYTSFSRYISGRYLKNGSQKSEVTSQGQDTEQSSGRVSMIVPKDGVKNSVSATSEHAHDSTTGPRKAGVEKKIPFGEEKFDLDKDIYGCKED